MDALWCCPRTARGRPVVRSVRASANRYNAVLRVPAFRRLWLSQAVSETGDWLGRVVLALVVYEKTGSPALTSSVAAIAVLPYLGAGQLLTARVARLRSRNVLIGSDVARAVVYLSMALSPPVVALLLLELTNGLLTVPFESIRAAVVPQAAGDEHLADALALSAMTQEMAILVGYGLGGLLFDTTGAAPLFALNAGSFVASAVLLLGLPRPRRSRRQPATTTSRSELADAGRFLWHDTLLRRWLLSYALAAGCALSAEALAPVFVQRELGAGSASVGIVSAMSSVGVIGLAVALPKTGPPRTLIRVGGAAGVTAGVVGAALFAIAMPLPLAILPFIAAGAVFGTRLPGYQVASVKVPEQIRANAFSVYVGLVAAGGVIVPPIFGLFTDRLGVRTVMIAALLGAAAASAAAVAAPRLPGEVDVQPG